MAGDQLFCLFAEALNLPKGSKVTVFEGSADAAAQLSADALVTAINTHGETGKWPSALVNSTLVGGVRAVRLFVAWEPQQDEEEKDKEQAGGCILPPLPLSAAIADAGCWCHLLKPACPG